MANQGLITVRKEGKVVLKIVAGSDGYNAPRLEAAIRQLGRVPELQEAYYLARAHSFGIERDLVVLSEDNHMFLGDEDFEERYRRTFHQPEFNPRWDKGTADHTIVIDF